MGKITEEECIEFLSSLIENDPVLFTEINEIQKINEYIQRNINQWQYEYENKMPILIKEGTIEKMRQSFDYLAMHNDNLKKALEDEPIHFQIMKSFATAINKDIDRLIPNYVNILGEIEKVGIVIK